MAVDASEALLDALWSHATQPAFQWHHDWRAGDILIWDNRCVMHHRNPFDGGHRRVMHRVQCAGERPAHDSRAAKVRHARASAAAV
jgi:taurine dioxygenase